MWLWGVLEAVAIRTEPLSSIHWQLPEVCQHMAAGGTAFMFANLSTKMRNKKSLIQGVPVHIRLFVSAPATDTPASPTANQGCKECQHHAEYTVYDPQPAFYYKHDLLVTGAEPPA